jgi:hypothetical protein
MAFANEEESQDLQMDKFELKGQQSEQKNKDVISN